MELSNLDRSQLIELSLLRRQVLKLEEIEGARHGMSGRPVFGIYRLPVCEIFRESNIRLKEPKWSARPVCPEESN